MYSTTSILIFDISIIRPVREQDNTIDLAPDRYFYDAWLLRYSFSKLGKMCVDLRVQNYRVCRITANYVKRIRP